MKHAVLLLPLLFLTACTAPPPAPVTYPQPTPVTAAKSVPAAEPIPSLLQVAGWLAIYGMEVVTVSESPTWSASYPTSGNPVVRFVWQTETIVPAAPGESFTSLRVLTLAAHQDSFRARVAGVDSLGNQGGFSEWGSYHDTDGPQLNNR